MLRIALAQCRRTADFDVNAATILSFLNQAIAARAQIVCFPEAQTVGYRVDISDARIACILGTEIPSPVGKPYNSALLVNESGQILGAHHKFRLTPLDAVAYGPGQDFETWTVCGIVIGVVIRYGGFRYAETTATCVDQGALLVFHPQNNTARSNDWKIPIHHAMTITRAAENTVWFASCNACLDTYQNCQTMIVVPDGRIHANAAMKREELLVADIDITKATHAMYRYDISAELLFANTVDRGEYEEIL